jgi:hypothetical protein
MTNPAFDPQVLREWEEEADKLGVTLTRERQPDDRGLIIASKSGVQGRVNGLADIRKVAEAGASEGGEVVR